MTKRETPFRYYEQGQDGRWYLTLGGERLGRFHPVDRGYATEEEAKSRLRSWNEESDDADEDERRFNVQ